MLSEIKVCIFMNNQSNMHELLKSIFISLIFSFVSYISFAQSKINFLPRVEDKTKHGYGYVNSKGDTVIPIGKYDFCFTEKFYKFAIVSLPGKGIVGINQCPSRVSCKGLGAIMHFKFYQLQLYVCKKKHHRNRWNIFYNDHVL